MSTVSKYQQAVIYEIYNDVDELTYIGSAIDMEKRFKRHKYDAKRKPDAGLLYPHMNRIGIEHFHVRKIEDYPTTSNEALLLREKHVIEERKPQLNTNLYVITDWEDINKRRKVIVDEYLKEDQEYVTRIGMMCHDMRYLYVTLLRNKVWSKLTVSQRTNFINLLDEWFKKTVQYRRDNPYHDPPDPNLINPTSTSSHYLDMNAEINRKLDALEEKYTEKIFKMVKRLMSKYSLLDEDICCEYLATFETYKKASEEYLETEHKLLNDNSNERVRCEYCDVTTSINSRHTNSKKHMKKLKELHESNKLTDPEEIQRVKSSITHEIKMLELKKERKELKKETTGVNACKFQHLDFEGTEGDCDPQRCLELLTGLKIPTQEFDAGELWEIKKLVEYVKRNNIKISIIGNIYDTDIIPSFEDSNIKGVSYDKRGRKRNICLRKIKETEVTFHYLHKHPEAEGYLIYDVRQDAYFCARDLKFKRDMYITICGSWFIEKDGFYHEIQTIPDLNREAIFFNRLL